jgi:hypothetical protein
MATTEPRGVALGVYRAQSVGVRVTCRDCQLHHDWPLEAVEARLEARGVAGERVGIVELADHVRAPCRRCGGRRFTTAPAFA